MSQSLTITTQTGTTITISKGSLFNAARLSLIEAISIARRENKKEVKLTVEKAAIIAEALAGNPIGVSFKTTTIKNRRAFVGLDMANAALKALGN